jgi:hypothetical protein
MNLETKTCEGINIGDNIIFIPDFSNMNKVLEGISRRHYKKLGLEIGKEYKIVDVTKTTYPGTDIPHTLFKINVKGNPVELGCKLFSKTYN